MKQSDTSHATILITGGHITPALATIDEIQSRFPHWNIRFVGRKTALEGTSTASEEYRMVQALGIPFVPIDAGRVKRDGSLWTLWSLCKIPIGLAQSFWYIWRQKPDIVLSFGGYVAVPVVIAAWISHIPVVTHEQTTQPGLANRFIARVARVVCTSFPKQEKQFFAKTTHTGLPIRKSLFVQVSHSAFSVEKTVPMVFITGGSTGSMSINTVVYRALPDLLRRYTIIHQTGRLSIDMAAREKSLLPKHLSHRYIPVPYLDLEDYRWVVQHADLMVGRSGANTVMEAAALGKIAVWIPLPWAANNEQKSNAQFLVDAGSAMILPQRILSTATLLASVASMLEKQDMYLARASTLAGTIPQHAARAVVTVLVDVLAKRR